MKLFTCITLSVARTAIDPRRDLNSCVFFYATLLNFCLRRLNEGNLTVSQEPPSPPHRPPPPQLPPHSVCITVHCHCFILCLASYT